MLLFYSLGWRVAFWQGPNAVPRRFRGTVESPTPRGSMPIVVRLLWKWAIRDSNLRPLVCRNRFFLLFLTSVEFATDCKLTIYAICFSNFRYENRAVSGRKPASKSSNRYKKSVRIVTIPKNRRKSNFMARRNVPSARPVMAIFSIVPYNRPNRLQRYLSRRSGGICHAEPRR